MARFNGEQRDYAQRQRWMPTSHRYQLWQLRPVAVRRGLANALNLL